MFCSNCGKELKGDEKFCPACGTKNLLATDNQANSDWMELVSNEPVQDVVSEDPVLSPYDLTPGERKGRREEEYYEDRKPHTSQKTYENSGKIGLVAGLISLGFFLSALRKVVLLFDVTTMVAAESLLNEIGVMGLISIAASLFSVIFSAIGLKAYRKGYAIAGLVIGGILLALWILGFSVASSSGSI